MITLNKRVAWAINYYKEKYNLSWPVLAKKLGTNKDTVAKYAKNLGEFVKGSVIDALGNECGFDPLWLIQGTGEPFTGARNEFPEVCGIKIEKHPLYKEFMGGDREIISPPEYKASAFGQAVDQLRIIFNNLDPPFVQAVAAALRALAGFAEYGQQTLTLQSKVDSLEKQIVELKAGAQREGGVIQGDASNEETGRTTEKKAG